MHAIQEMLRNSNVLYTGLCPNILIEQSFTSIEHTLMLKYSNRTVNLSVWMSADNQGSTVISLIQFHSVPTANECTLKLMTNAMNARQSLASTMYCLAATHSFINCKISGIIMRP